MTTNKDTKVVFPIQSDNAKNSTLNGSNPFKVLFESNIKTQPNTPVNKVILNARVTQLLHEVETPLGILTFGQDIVDNIAKKADEALSQMEDSDINFVTTQLSSIMSLAQQYDIGSSESTNIFSNMLSLIKSKLVDAKETSLAQINSISTQMDRVVNEIDKTTNNISIKINNLAILYNENLQDYKQLESLIEDLKTIKNIKQEQYNKLSTKSNLLPLDTEELNKLNQVITRLDKKLMTFEKITMLAMQTAPRIRNIQETGYTLLEKFHIIKTVTIPLWKRQASLYSSSITMMKGAMLANTIDDANNNLILAGATLDKKNAIQAAKLSQRDIVDTSTILEANKILIETISEVVSINQQGHNDRIKSRELLEQAKTEYITALTNTH
ncbi:MAG: toxic anion resistance protein [Nitrososphaeraceae archaeon]